MQFRSDIAGPHEARVIMDVTRRGYADFRFINALAPDTTGEELLDLGQRSEAVILGGRGEGGYESADEKGKADLERIRGKIKPTVEYLIEQDVPTLGICFGHQLIADMAGGEVGPDEATAETGITEISVTEAGRADTIFQDVTNGFSAVVGHHASVLRLPEGAVHLARSVMCENQAFRLGKNVYGVMFHPELDMEGLKWRLNVYSGQGYEKNSLDYDEAAEIKAPLILKRFVERAEAA